MRSRPLDAGLKVIYNAPFDKIKQAAFDSLIERGFSYKNDYGWDERNERAFYINSSKGLALGSTGQYARVVIEKTDTEQTVFVLVETRASSHDSAAADEDVAKGIHSGIEKRVTAK